MDDELVSLEVKNGMGTITLNSPDNGNALSRRLTADLSYHLEVAIEAPAVRVIVLTGTGRTFCSGADLKARPVDPEAPPYPRPPASFADILARLWNCPKPVVGAINGAARAGGIGLVAACDIAVAEQSTTFGITEVRIGVIPAVISAVVLPKLGRARSLELFLTGDVFSAEDACRYGLLAATAPDGQLDSLVERYVGSLRKGAPAALAGCKQLVADVSGMNLEEALKEMSARSASFFASEEAAEGRRAFAEKRTPNWAI